MRGDGGNHHQTLGFKRIWCASKSTIPDMAGTSPYPACIYTGRRSSQPNQASYTPDFSYPLVSSTEFSTSLPSLFSSSTTLPSLQNSMFSHLSLSLHVIIISLHRVPHTPSTSIHQVQAYTKYKYTPSTASTQDCFSSLHSQD